MYARNGTYFNTPLYQLAMGGCDWNKLESVNFHNNKKNTYVVGTVILRCKIESRLVLSVPSTI